MGYRSRPMNIYDKETRRVLGQTRPKKLDTKQLNRFMARTIYCGVKCERWNQDQPVKTAFEPLVPISLFNRANRGKLRIEEAQDGSLRIIEDRAEYKRQRHNPEFLLRHVVTCPKCGKPLLASCSRGKSGKYFAYYHCSRGHPYFGVNKAEFESTVAYALIRLQAKPGFLPLFREVVRDVWIQKNRSLNADNDQVRAHAEELQARQDALLDAHTAARSEVVREKLEHQIDELEASIRDLKRKAVGSVVKEDEIDAYFAIAKNLMEHPVHAIMNAATKEKTEKLWSFVFRSRPSYADLTDGTPDLTLIYRYNRGFPDNKNQLAGQLVSGWNTFEVELKTSTLI